MITSVKLTNFKKYNDHTVTFIPEVTLLVGGNNEGKSTILHALAIWEFCKNYILRMRGKDALCIGNSNSGVGMSIDDFSPVNVPELKYLWTNLKPSSGYNLKIKCEWNPTDVIHNHYLEIGLALSNERLFIKATDTNITAETHIPSIAYLPTFAGISDKERWYYPAERRRLLGQGLAGAVLRNTIIDMHTQNLQTRLGLKGSRTKISNKDLAEHRQNDPFEQLNSVIFDIFKCILKPKQFDQSFHSYVKVEIVKGEIQNKRFTPFPNFKPRDIMVEGSGFLQWLSVYTFALDKSIDILLLDEPDAHLHCSLQSTLMSRLLEIAKKNNKQILIATHSIEIVKGVPFEVIMDVNDRRCRYLNVASERTRLLTGLGTEYSPILNEAQKTKNILFVENDSDAIILKHFTKAIGRQWPTNLTIWPNSYNHNERNHIMLFLKDQIPDIQSISLSDLDNGDYSNTLPSLIDKGYGNDIDHQHILYRKWRRREIENYLLCKPTMSRVSGYDESSIDTFFAGRSIAYPEMSKFIQSDIDISSTSLFKLPGKEILDDFCKGYIYNKFTIAQEMHLNEICDDVKTIINQIIQMCNRT